MTALRNITLKGPTQQGAIKRGEFVIIRGPSGGGKTTFLNLLGTIDKPSGGSLCTDGPKQGSKGTRWTRATRTRM